MTEPPNRYDMRFLTIDGEDVTFQIVHDPERPISTQVNFTWPGPPRAPILVAKAGGWSVLLADNLSGSVTWATFPNEALIRMYREKRDERGRAAGAGQ